MMNILLVNPVIPHCSLLFDYAGGSETALKTREMDGPPLALNDIAGMLADENVRILDLRALYDRNPSADIKQILVKELEALRPEIVGLTCMTAQVNVCRDLLQTIKDHDRDILTVVGGIHPTACPDDFRNHPADLIVIGMGKRTFRAIVDEVKANRRQADFSSIPGIAVNRKDKIIFTKQLSELDRSELAFHYCSDVFPNRSLTDEHDYRVENGKKRIHYLNTSIGCTAKCNFCYLWKFYNGYYIYRDVKSIVSELKTMSRYSVVRFCDAHTFGDPKSADELFRQIQAEGLSFEYVADLRADTVVRYPAVIRNAVKAGLKVAIIGLEATTDAQLKKYNKNSTIAITEQAMDILNDLGVWISGNYIVPCEADDADFDQMNDFVEKHPIYFSGFTIITPFPGTGQYESLKDKIVIKNYDYYNLTNAVMKTVLPENRFYTRVNDLYKTGLAARQKFLHKYPAITAKLSAANPI